jgi:Protein of unknown function (DUF4019)
MMNRTRGTFALLALMALLLTGNAGAQDARTSSVQSAARRWLAMVDRGDVAASYAGMSKLFKDSISQGNWAISVKQVRTPLGPIVERSMLSTQFSTTMPKAPDGDYSLVIFRTAFANKTDVRETVTLSREADGVWRVVGYMAR